MYISPLESIMRQMQVCSHGHRWDPLADSRDDTQARFSVCPVCGASVEMFSLHDTPSSHSGTAVATPPTTPPVIHGYEILEVLGYGGMGVVYKVRQADPQRVVALKMLSAGLRARPSELARFEKEAQAARWLAHPNIVQVFDVGKHEGLPYV